MQEKVTVAVDVTVDPLPICLCASSRSNPHVVRSQLKLFNELLNDRLNLWAIDLHQAVILAYTPVTGVDKGS